MKFTRENENAATFAVAAIITASSALLFRLTYDSVAVGRLHTALDYGSSLYYFYLAIGFVFSLIGAFITFRLIRIRWERRSVLTVDDGQDAWSLDRLKELYDRLYATADAEGRSVFVRRIIDSIAHIHQTRISDGSTDLRFIIEHSENNDDDQLMQTFRLFDVCVYLILFLGFSGFSLGDRKSVV
mgnify:FL=1